MAARPTPHSALKVCVQVAQNSVGRLKAAIEGSERVLNTNARLTKAERAHYHASIKTAKTLLPIFQAIAATKLPKEPPKKAPKRIGRPSYAEVAKNEAIREREKT